MARDYQPLEFIKASHINQITPDDGEIIVGGPDAPVRRPITDFENAFTEASSIADFDAAVAASPAVGRVDPGDSPAYTFVVRDALGVPRSSPLHAISAVAEGLVPNSSAGSIPANNMAVMRDIMAAGYLAQLPKGAIYYDTTLPLAKDGGMLGPDMAQTTLIFIGSGNGMEAVLAPGVRMDRILLSRFALEFAGSGTGHGFATDSMREGVLDRIRIQKFPGSGLYLYGTSADQGTWSNLIIHSSLNQNGRMGVEAVGKGHNANTFVKSHASRNGLDGVYAEKSQGWGWGLQVEGNGRHGVWLRGAKSENLYGLYLEHQDPGRFAPESRPPGWSTQTPRYGIRIGAAPDGTRSDQVSCIGAGHLTGAHGATAYTGSGLPSTVTDAVLYAEDTDGLLFFGNRTSGAIVETIVQSSVSRSAVFWNGDRDLADKAVLQTYVNQQYRSATGAHPRSTNGFSGASEGYSNPVVNGGFETWTTDPGVPDGWAQIGAGTYTSETGTDGRKRAVITNIGTNQSGLKQVVTGDEVGSMVRHGLGVLVFDASFPSGITAGTLPQANVICQDGGGGNVGGGYTAASTALQTSTTEKTYELQFYVPANTVQIEIRFYASRGTISNTNIFKLDRVALYAGEIPKAYAPRKLDAPVAPAAIPDTSGATLAALETEVNKLKAALRPVKIIGS